HDATTDAEIVNPLDVGPASISMNIDELASTSGLTRVQLKALEDAGVVVGRQVGGATIYDDDALLVTRASAGLLEMGLEVRHLRSYKVAAEREAGVLEQLLAAQAHNRSPEARHQTTQALGKLVILGEELRRAMLRRSLRGSIIH
ncbi:MAG: hypothetical protein OEU32_11445, partial [Acidimicrobiia bacterium]|nr:hypothetical protein [Acidimicrobiia bacterium]